jgi:hypothetical protein
MSIIIHNERLCSLGCPACNAHVPNLSSVACPALQYFSTLWHDYREKKLSPPPMPQHVHTKFRGPLSWLWRKCNRLLRLGRPWRAVRLSRRCDGLCTGRWSARRGLKSRSTNYPDHGHDGDPPPTWKIPMVEPRIETGTSWLVVRCSDH